MAPDDARRRGRPESFDRDQVVRRAVDAFWAGGYDQTSLSMLESETGVDRSTLYNSFGGKAGLYRSAAERYVDELAAAMCAPLRDTEDGFEALRSFLDVLDEVTGSDAYPAGCLVVNDLPSPSHDRTATDRYLGLLAEGFDDALRRAGVSDAANRIARRDVLLGLIIGINAVAHHDAAAARSMIHGARTLLSEWQTERSG